MQYQFETLNRSVTFPIHFTFMEAWEDMYQYVMGQLNSGGISAQILETALWILQNGRSPIYFCDARDKAISDYGWTLPEKKS